jgi:hypothetical protein
VLHLDHTPHDFRRIFATEAVAGGLPIHVAAKLLGYQDLNTTQTYAAVYQDDVLRHHAAFIARRRAERPGEEYREPTATECSCSSSDRTNGAFGRPRSAITGAIPDYSTNLRRATLVTM